MKDMNLKSLLHCLGKLAFHVLIAVLVGTLLLTAVYLLPVGAMEANLAASAGIFAEEGTYPVLFSWCTSNLDNFTDAIILSHAAHAGSGSAMVQAMTAARNGIAGLDPAQAISAHYLNGQGFNEVIPYYQYWHGYLLLIKPLLLVTGYQGIRMINLAVQTLLLGVLLALMVKKGLKAYILPYLIAVAFLMPTALAMSLQFSSCYYILTLGSIAVLLLERRLDALDILIFLYLGIATAYFDFLTYPIASLGIPAVFYFCLRSTASIRNTFCRGVRICFAWGFGYGMMWAAKWLVGSLITGINVLSVASERIGTRTSATNVDQSQSALLNLYAAVSVNIKNFIRTPATVLFAIFLLAVLILLIRKFLRREFTPAQAVQVLFPFFVLACMPVVWYVVTANHSTIHYWFTGKALVVSVLAAAFALVKLHQAPSSHT